MKNRILMALLGNVVAVLALSTPVFADVQATPSMAELAEQVRATEIAFAKTLADRDVKAFTSMIAPDVIWLGDKPYHGPAEVVESWKQFFEGPTAPFSWAPEIVEVQEGGKLALSTGPVFNPEGKRVATYTSIWRREKSGQWLIIFDRGCPACDCAAEKK
jgi:ketosteroid isomerase-like protein